MKHLEELFLDELADMYDAEHRLTKALPKMVKAATHEELKEAFQKHLDETEGQVARLEKVFQVFDRRPKAKRCEAMVGLIKEADDIVSDNKGQPTINAALICAAQKVEHYEIASYGCLRTWAEQLGQEEAAQTLQDILDEEKAADEALTELAQHRCNESAQEEDTSEDEDTYSSPRGSRAETVHAKK